MKSDICFIENENGMVEVRAEQSEEGVDLIVVEEDEEWYILTVTHDGFLVKHSGIESKNIKTNNEGMILEEEE